MPLPPVGTRVVIRYRLPAGSTPPLTDVIGHLLSTGAAVRVRTKRGDVVSVDSDDVVTIKELAAAPVRTSDIRNVEHAAALAWPGLEHQWLDGWLLRSARGVTHRGNSAVPLGVEADVSALPAIAEHYTTRGLTPWLSLPDRLFRLPGGVRPHLETLVMVRDAGVEAGVDADDDPVRLLAQPDPDWMRVYERDVPIEVLTATVDGEVVFGSIPGAAVGRAAVTDAPDGTRWVGLSAVRVAEDQRRTGYARQLCAALLAWGAEHGAARAYLQVLVDNTAASRLFESMAFTVQHRSRYVPADAL
ncbi:N-acetylglutamate synthase, CG3035 family [Mycobacterium deserti]|uniref:GNAT family N-acetyltransferase n=1 Tax=Mycobacterium deserti TaxID=2978347 RepID=A0ABT2MAL5_9MYCO|nr:GNAT family N-acetyltransferase [Mycobacterium deserti]MCT7658629.1 GNAT family N-acetyltransferase [Mycobacterium deserti]